MKKACLVMTMVFLAMFLTTGCGYRLQVVKTDNVVTEEHEEDKETYASTESVVNLSITEETTGVAENMSEKMKDYQVIIDVPAIVSELSEEPEWNMERFGSIDAFKDFCSTMSIPKAITDIYDEHKEKGTLNDRGAVEFFCSGRYSSAFVVYQEQGKYRISYKFATYNAKEVVGQGCFRSKDNNLVIISVLTYSNHHLVSGHTSDYLPEQYTEFSREEINNEGRISMRMEYLDTALLKDRNFKKVMVCPEFTVLFYPNTNQFLCVKDSTPIGPKTNVNSIDLEGLNWKGNTSLAILNKGNTLVYPVIVQNDKGTSFELLHVAEDINNFSNELLWIEKNGVRYPIVNENSIYYLENAKAVDYEVSYDAYQYADEIDWLVSANPIVVNSDEVVLKQYDIKYDEFQYELWDGVEGGYICMLATSSNSEMKLWGKMDAPVEHCIYSAQQENKFAEYITEDGTYKIPTYSELQKVLNVLGIEVE